MSDLPSLHNTHWSNPLPLPPPPPSQPWLTGNFPPMMQQQMLSHPSSIYPAASPLPLEGEGLPSATPKRKLAALAAGEGGDDGVREQDRFLRQLE